MHSNAMSTVAEHERQCAMSMSCTACTSDYYPSKHFQSMQYKKGLVDRLK